MNTGAIYNSSSDNELIAKINKVLHNPGAHTVQRRNLVGQETSVDTGRAVICTARRIAQLAKKFEPIVDGVEKSPKRRYMYTITC